MLFFQPQKSPESIGNVDWLEQLDLNRAYVKLQSMTDFGLPWTTASSSLFQVSLKGRESLKQPIKPFGEIFLENALKMHAGPIPGFDASRLITTSSNPQLIVKASDSTQLSTKRRTLSDDKSRPASPASERSGNASPLGSTGGASKKPRSQSIVHTTYYSSR